MVSTPKPIIYDEKTSHRALVAFACAPFQWHLLASMRDNSVSLTEISGVTGQDKGYTTKVLPELKAEHFMMWLIRVGLLRREVDGQGLTNSFRLTPLGRTLLEQWRNQDLPDTIPTADRFLNNFRCWFNRFSL